MSTVWYDPVATLSFLAGITEHVRLLSHVAILGLRHPLISAKQYATLDHLSGGRLILGVGAGHVQEEFEILGVDFARRGAVLDETLDALRAALGPEEYPEFEGELFSFKDLGQLPRPAQERIPVWVGGSSPAAVRRAALRGDGWLPQGDPAREAPGADRPHQGAARRGRGGRPRRVRRDHRGPVRRRARLGHRPPHPHRQGGGARRVPAGVQGARRGPDPGPLPQSRPRRARGPDHRFRGRGGPLLNDWES